MWKRKEVEVHIHIMFREETGRFCSPNNVNMEQKIFNNELRPTFGLLISGTENILTLQVVSTS